MNTHEKLINMGLENCRVQLEGSLPDGLINDFIISDLKMCDGKILLILTPEITAEVSMRKEPPKDSKDKRLMDKIRHTIHENYHNPLFDVPAFAGCLGISKTLLNRKLRELEGISTGRFIHNYRLEMAKKLLLMNKVTREKNISEIAYEAGFNDPRYFTRCFRESFGILPSQL